MDDSQNPELYDGLIRQIVTRYRINMRKVNEVLADLLQENVELEEKLERLEKERRQNSKV
ncbi:hypothetical protein GF389_02300 [Candidatus Dojkabacteria bacterium]|nr:hypothetical protein [Candidatus Dojkabacteria bacterium]